jgi:hypothetical protein
MAVECERKRKRQPPTSCLQILASCKECEEQHCGNFLSVQRLLGVSASVSIQLFAGCLGYIYQHSGTHNFLCVCSVCRVGQNHIYTVHIR